MCIPMGGGDPIAPAGGGDPPRGGGGVPDGAGPSTASGSGGGAPTLAPADSHVFLSPMHDTTTSQSIQLQVQLICCANSEQYPTAASDSINLSRTACHDRRWQRLCIKSILYPCTPCSRLRKMFLNCATSAAARGGRNSQPSGGGDPANPIGGGEAPVLVTGGGWPTPGAMDGAGPSTASGSGGGAPTLAPADSHSYL